MLVAIWNHFKANWSRANDWIMRGASRRPVPSFKSPEDVAKYLLTHGRYQGDWAGGALDNYTSPERFQYAMETGDWGSMPTDCDDYALWAYKALKTVPGCQPTIFTLRDSGLVGSHVVCAYRHGTTCGVIDTNGHRVLPDLSPETLCSTFVRVYSRLGYSYVEAVPTPYPL